MQISNDDLARILGRMEAKLDEQAKSSLRLESGLTSLDTKLTQRLDGHEGRLRTLELANPQKNAENVAALEIRVSTLEKGAAKAGAVAGIASSVGIAVLVEILKRKFGGP